MFQTRWMLQTRIKNRLIRRGIVALALLATLPGAPVAAGQTFDEAEAVQRYRKAGEQGDVKAQWILGDMYNYGLGVPDGRCRSCALVPAGCRAGERLRPMATSAICTN